ncbi:cell division protein FtsI [Halalkalibacter hemicellulosilyticusJCM 9152]|uniref:serine-type D-Ala-D-Ala carboxypeptidase n=2 Tax=Halalkalibacter TaxID=2893056 RepID=W4QFL5_9BACI|nr:cell division protein FtsI [Halalkalibacter hemicellulosilyticusJCM 9152]
MGRMKKGKKKHHVPARLNVLFFAVFILFAALILRLGMVQIVEGEEYVKELQRTSNATARIDAPRGVMFDRYGHVVVDNELELSITYTNPSEGTSNAELMRVATELSPLLEMDTSRVTDRDIRDYILINMSQEDRLELVPAEERRDLDNTEEYLLEIEAITDEMVEAVSEDELQTVAVFREMVRGYANTPQRIKRDISEEEAHVISENLYRLDGVDILRDSRRSYVYGESFRSFFGSTGQIPRERLDAFLARGYDRSDIVGTSFIEAQYEDVLRGQKAVVESVMTQSGSQTVNRDIDEREGQRGNDLVLTLDMELQQVVEQAIEKEVTNGNPFLLDRSAYAIFMDPKTGDILSMAGYFDPHDMERSTYADHLGTVNKVFEMGSSIKGASVLTGYQEGIISPGSQLHDRIIRLNDGLGGFIEKSSIGRRTYGWINDRRALEVSSNVYMFEIGLRMAGCYNSNTASCTFATATTHEAFDRARYNFSQFGLGTETGIDLPSASNGFLGSELNPGNLADLMIGQFDTYTTLQLAQYVSTIAHDGYRMQPRLVSEIREPVADRNELGAIVQQFEPKLLNRINNTDDEIAQVQRGFRDVVTGGTASEVFRSKSYDLAAKTGTAQVRVAVGEPGNRRVVEANNQTLVGYAPYDDPEIAFAIVVPQVKLDNQGGRGRMAQRIAEDVLDWYFEREDSMRNGPVKPDTPLLEDVDSDEEAPDVIE